MVAEPVAGEVAVAVGVDDAGAAGVVFAGGELLAGARALPRAIAKRPARRVCCLARLVKSRRGAPKDFGSNRQAS